MSHFTLSLISLPGFVFVETVDDEEAVVGFSRMESKLVLVPEARSALCDLRSHLLLQGHGRQHFD